MERNTNVTKFYLNKDAYSVKSVSCDNLVVLFQLQVCVT